MGRGFLDSHDDWDKCHIPRYCPVMGTLERHLGSKPCCFFCGPATQKEIIDFTRHRNRDVFSINMATKEVTFQMG